VANLSDRFANFPLKPLRMLMSKTEMAEREEYRVHSHSFPYSPNYAYLSVASLNIPFP
jgi:hypothetical protein